MPPKIAVICGPTASGKTKLGVALAKALNGEVVSADSMQVYRGMDIGTAKPTEEEREGVPHHMMDVAAPHENYSVARYVEEASHCVEDILRRGKLPLIVGGTGLYIDSLCKGLDFAAKPKDSRRRDALSKQAELEGIAALWETLEKVDPETALTLHPNDRKRIIRALEVYEESGKPLSAHNRESQSLPPRYERAVIGLRFQDRQDQRERIDHRVDEMMACGLLREVEGLLDQGVPLEATAMQAIGYKELAACIMAGRPPDEGALEIKLRSKQYAKRQLSWFRRNAAIHWLLWEKSPNFSSALQDSIRFLQGEGLG